MRLPESDERRSLLKIEFVSPAPHHYRPLTRLQRANEQRNLRRMRSKTLLFQCHADPLSIAILFFDLFVPSEDVHILFENATPIVGDTTRYEDFSSKHGFHVKQLNFRRVSRQVHVRINT